MCIDALSGVFKNSHDKRKNREQLKPAHIPAVKVHLGYYWILCCHEHKNALAIKTIIGLTNLTERDQLFCKRYSCRSLYQRWNKWHLTIYTSLPSDLKEMTGLCICRSFDVTWEHVYLVAGDSANCKHSHRNYTTIVSRCDKTLRQKWTTHTCNLQSEIFWKRLIWIPKPQKNWLLISWCA